MSASTPTVDVERACQIWEEYQKQHDVSDRIGQTAGIDPVSERVWFGESGIDIYKQMEAEGKSLLVVEVFPGSYKPYYLKAKGKHQGTYIRIGSTNKQASQEILEELERQRRNVSFDSLPAYDVAWHELDLTGFLTDYSRATGRTLEETPLKNLGLLIRERENSHPSNAAILLSDSPYRKRLFPFAKIECARFKGTTPHVFIDQATIDPPIYLATEACIAFIKKNIALGSTIGEVYRKDRWEYPLEAIREALINAIIHRDYSLTGSDIKIAIFDDMLEVTSPGPLPDTLSVEDLGTGRSEIRNRVLAPIFKDLGLLEAWGTGMQKIQQAALNDPEIEVVFQEVGYAFQVQFRKKGAGAVSSPETGQAPDRLWTGSGQVAAFRFLRRGEVYPGDDGPLKAQTPRDIPQKLSLPVTSRPSPRDDHPR